MVPLHGYKLLPYEKCYNMKNFNSHPLKSSSTCELWVNFYNILERYFQTFYHLLCTNLHICFLKILNGLILARWWGNIFLLKILQNHGFYASSIATKLTIEPRLLIWNGWLCLIWLTSKLDIFVLIEKKLSI
jgi:hypothetical protein